MKQLVPAVKFVVAFILVGAAKLLGIKWNPWVSDSRVEKNE